MKNKLQKILGRKVDIIVEGDLFKVRINDIEDRKEAENIILKLQKNGISELWLINLKAKKQEYIIGQKQDTITRITETIIPASAPKVDEGLIIQAGAFIIRLNAFALKDILARPLNQKLIIVKKNGLYEVRLNESPVIKESVLDAMKTLKPLKDIKLKDLFFVPVKTEKAEKIPEISRTEVVPPMKVVTKVKIPKLGQMFTANKKIESTIKAPVVSAEPAYSLQIGSFYRRSEALRAQRRIRSKLNLPAEIVQQWDLYHVIIPGFNTREETYKYYPELAGLGYPGASLIEKR
jgi:cell division protein FtsN